MIDGRFEIERLAGAGGMGKVYRAIDREERMPVALKVLSDPDGSTARFLREARILAELRHPRIVRHVADGTLGTGEPYLAMEWLDGESLSERLGRGGLSVEESVAFGRAAAEALAAAHARGIVHCDIKPSNLFLVGGDVNDLKVLDFGIARPDRTTAILTRSASVLGTPGYMAPEQARGDGESIGARADVFSLGAVLFECLTGRPAFMGTHVMALLAKLLLDEVPRVREIRPDVPKSLDDLVRRMLLKDPEARPQDGAALVRALDALDDLDGRTPSVRLPPRKVLAAGERRLVSVAIAVPRPEDKALTTETKIADGVPRELMAKLRALTEPLGARVESIAGGGVVVLLSGAASPTDQAALAARCALRMRALLLETPIALLTRWGEDTGRSPLAQLLEQAAMMLAEDAGGELDTQACSPVRVDDVTRALLDARFEVVQEAGRTVLLREREDETANRTLLGRPTPYVGRERELRNLFDLILEGFEEGRALALLVTAPPGMGKSRLRRELVRRVLHARPDVGMAIGRGDSMAAGSAFVMIGSAFRSGLQMPAGEPVEAQREKVVRAAATFVQVGHRQRVAEFLGELIGAPFPDENSPKLMMARQNASIMADQIQTAYIDFVRAVCEVQPVLLVLEDLHWGDSPSIKLVDAALRELRDKPYVVLALARPEVHGSFPRLWADRIVHEVRLSGLSRRAAESLARSVLGEAVDAETVAAIVERADGNAFFLEELIRAVAEGQRGALPETVLGMVEARLRALPLAERRWLRAASLFGEAFWRRGVRALLGEEAGDGQDCLSNLIERELIGRRAEGRFAGEEEFAFRHALIQEAAYATLTERDATFGHVLAAEWLLAAGEQDPKLIAQHFERGRDAMRAAQYYLRAAEQAMRGADNTAAIALSERAIGLGAEGETAAALWAIQGDAGFWSNDPARALRAAEAALQLATPGGKNECRALASAVCSALLLQRSEAMQAPMRRMLEIEPIAEGVPALVWGYQGAVAALLIMGQRDMAEAYLHHVEKIAAPRVPFDPFVAGWVATTEAFWFDYAEGDPWRALERGREAMARFEQAGDRRYVLNSRMLIGGYLTLLGAFEQAEEELCIGLQGASPESTEAWVGGLHLSHIYLQTMDIEKARALAAPWVESASAHGNATALLRDGAVLADADLLTGRTAEAEERARALHAMMPATYFGLEPHAVLADICLNRGNAHGALQLAEEWLDISRSFRMIHEKHARVLLVRARALHALGRIDEAREALREACDDLLARAARIGDPKLRRSFLERVSANARTLALHREWFGEEPP